jgi:hypothetical protein
MAPRKEEPYFARLAEQMVRNNQTVWQASVELGLGLRDEEAKKLSLNPAFQQVLYQRRNQIAKEIATDPQRDKNTTIGKMVICMDRLMNDDAWEKAANVGMNILKAEGHVGAESAINVFAGLSAKDIDAMKRKLKGEGEQAVDLTQLPN